MMGFGGGMRGMPGQMQRRPGGFMGGMMSGQPGQGQPFLRGIMPQVNQMAQPGAAQTPSQGQPQPQQGPAGIGGIGGMMAGLQQPVEQQNQMTPFTPSAQSMPQMMRGMPQMQQRRPGGFMGGMMSGQPGQGQPFLRGIMPQVNQMAQPGAAQTPSQGQPQPQQGPAGIGGIGGMMAGLQQPGEQQNQMTPFTPSAQPMPQMMQAQGMPQQAQDMMQSAQMPQMMRGLFGRMMR